jgi:hypothetical protein
LKNRIYLILLNRVKIYTTALTCAPTSASTVNEYNHVSSIISTNLLRVGISETIRTQQKIIKKFNLILRILKTYSILSINFFNSYWHNSFSTFSHQRIVSSTLIKNEIIKDNHNNEISLKFKE